MDTHLPPDLQSLADQYLAAEKDFAALTSGWTEEQGAWRETDHSWSVAEHLDHLATTNALYLGAMKVVADSAREKGRLRRGPATPGLAGGAFVRMLEPPVRPFLRFKAPKVALPRHAPPLFDALARFTEVNEASIEFMMRNVNTDLSGVMFKSPLAGSVRFSLASGLNILAVHNRRHLWHAQRVSSAGQQVHFGQV